MPSLWVSAAFLFLVFLGFGQVVEEILRYALLQSHTPDRLRGRVNSVWTAQATIGDSAGALTVVSVGTLAVAFAGLRTAQVLREPAVSPGEPASGGQLNQQ